MKITLEISKSPEQNASEYFSKAKIIKKKLEGARTALAESERKLQNLEVEESKKQERAKKQVRKHEWYEKFRWLLTSDNLLLIAGRDATTNELIIKKHTDKEDILFHTEMAGSPFGVLKTGSTASDLSKKEAAEFIAAYSKAWKIGRTVMDVFYVNPDQVTKEAPSGEYITKGSFMIYGKKTILTVDIELFIGRMADGRIMAGPRSAVEKHCKNFVQVVQGKDKISSVAKKIRKKLDADDLDEIVRLIPQGSAIP
jgi:predicted ribosome quality control (RQC) complex YloA/Tae2 family protein